MADVYVHIGLPKTGTTSIQKALQDSQQALSSHGVDFPTRQHRLQRLAVYDLLGRRISGADNKQMAGRWRSLVDAIDTADAPRAVLSDELLTISRPRQAKALVKSLSGHQVVVLVTVRDLGRLIPSAWQQEVVKGRTFTWTEYIGAVRDPEQGPVRVSVPYRMRFDLLRVLDVWEQALPRRQIQLVTVPPTGSPPDLLMDRFAAAIGVPPGVLRGGSPVRNEALGAVEVEVIRRLNTTLRSELSHAQFIAAVQRTLRSAIAGREGMRRLALPETERPWVVERTEALVRELRARGYQVHGSLADLEPQFAPAGQRPPGEVTDAELLPAMEDGLREMCRAYAQVWQRNQRLKAAAPTDASTRTRLSSSMRAASFGARTTALEHAETNPVLRWLARRQAQR